jgi:hypothetical protein
MTIQVKSWTGGTTPKAIKCVDREEKELVEKLYHDQIETYVNYWGEHPIRETLRTFWRRARYDAHATFRSRITFREAQFPNTVSFRRILVFVGDRCVGEVHESAELLQFSARCYEPFAVKDGFIEILGEPVFYGNLESAKQHFVSRFS